MQFQYADNFSVILFSVFALIMAGMCFKAISLSSSRKMWLVLYLSLILLISTAAISGVIAKSFLPFGPMLFALILIFGFAFSFSKSGKEITHLLPSAALIGFQSFRLPLELILHHWVSTGTIPETMTWSGQNWDIVSGIVSLVAIPFVGKDRKFTLAINLLGFVLLINVLRVVILSSPLPFSWQLEKPLLLLAYFPYCLIGPLFVLPALIGHLLVFRKIANR